VDDKIVERETERLAEEVKQASNAARRAATRAPEAVKQISGTVTEVTSEFAGFARRNQWFPILAAASFGLIVGIAVTARRS
jgi:hypothetical protein